MQYNIPLVNIDAISYYNCYNYVMNDIISYNNHMYFDSL